MKRERILSILIPLALTAGACSDDTVDIGHKDRALTTFAGTWIGYTEALSLDPDSDRIELTLDAAGQGYLVVGNDPPPPPVDEATLAVGTSIDQRRYSLIPGFHYPTYDAKVEMDRVRFVIYPLEPDRSWCETQTPFPDGNGAYRCTPDVQGSCDPTSSCVGTDPATGDTVTVDAWKFFACGFYKLCQCTADRCTALEDPPFRVDAALADGGTTLTGTLLLSGGTTITIRTSRQ